MHILLDARKIFHGGVGVYTQNLLKAFQDDAGIKFDLLINPEQEKEIQNKKFLQDINLIQDSAKIFSFDEFFMLTGRINQGKYDCYYSPFFNLPSGLKIPAIITIHDLIQITHPEKFYYPLVAKALISRAILASKKVVTVSEHSKNLIGKYFCFCPGIKNKLEVIPNAISNNFFAAVNPSAIKGEYLLCLHSNLKPHKGLKDLLEVFIEMDLNCKLVLAGQGIKELLSEHSLFDSIKVNSRIILLGEVTEKELIALYAGAKALLVPSLEEGFCLPVIQSHASGVPVIARPAPAVKELLTKHDICARDFSKEALKVAISNYSKLSKSEELIQNARKFSFGVLREKVKLLLQ